MRYTKKGVSPLIATVLLIAFAVSLGAVIMNLGINLASPCDSAQIKFFENRGEPKVCYNAQTNTIEVTITNIGADIKGFRVSAVGDVASEQDFLDELTADSTKVGRVSHTGTRVDVVTVFPIIVQGSEFSVCRESQITVDSIPSC